MTPDEARNLLGGYATGSLTEAERKALFEAALTDQDLFDELAGEQVLKEVLDEPGAKTRLLAALEPPTRQRGWLWWATAPVALAIVIGVVVSKRTPPPEAPQQIAQVTKSAEPVVTPEAPVAPPPKAALRKVAPAPAPSPPREVRQEELADQVRIDQIQEAKPQAAAGAVREFALSRAASVFAFNYAVGADGFLEIIPAASGFLSVRANDAVIFLISAVSAGTPIRIQIPDQATTLIVTFSRMPSAIGSPVPRDEAAGTVTDQDPPNGKISIQLSLKPATR